ncbi:MAG: phosphoesterase [Chlamydiae bacterium RIFCSPLOWO2_02_FULL_49_12]|nr:MAG: phosphoesterase [Chlamydiae bacterium RIFCSPLOWO2_02_FULL_49_12]
MSLWALADLHLSFSVPEKSMELFGPLWKGYAQKIERNWKAHVQADDLVLIAGDICWAVRFEEALVDLAWIDALPGTKALIRGNHDYWWDSKKKMRSVLPPSIRIIDKDALFWNGIAIGGARLWDSEEYHFDELIHFQENPHARVRTLEEREQKKERDERLFNRELDRLRLSLQQLDRTAKRRIALTHYPPIGNDLKPSLAAGILEEFRIDVCLFGHLHNLKKEMPLFGEARGVRYALTSCDYLDFTPLKIKI